MKIRSFLRATAIVALSYAFGGSVHSTALAKTKDDVALVSKAPARKPRLLTLKEGRKLLRAMAGPSSAQKAAMLDSFLGSTAKTTTFLAAFTVMPDDTGASGTEVSGSGYARVSITDNSTNYPAATSANPSVKSLATSESFPAATADWMSGANVVGFGLYSASTSGTFWCAAYALSNPLLVTVDATTDVFTSGVTQAFAANDAVRFVMGASGTLPTPLSASTTYYVIASGLTTTAFKIATTQGGSALDITANAVGSALRVFKSYVGPVINGTTLTIAANQLTVQLQGF